MECIQDDFCKAWINHLEFGLCALGLEDFSMHVRCGSGSFPYDFMRFGVRGPPKWVCRV